MGPLTGCTKYRWAVWREAKFRGHVGLRDGLACTSFGKRRKRGSPSWREELHMNMIKGIALCVALGANFLPGCSGRSSGDTSGSPDQPGTVAAGGSGASGGSASSTPAVAGGTSGAGSGIPPVTIQCQSASDCEQGQICCSETMKVGTVCQSNPCEPTLLGYPLQFCASDSECVTAGQACVATMVAGNIIQICRSSMATPGMGGAPSAGGTTGDGGSSNPNDMPGAGGVADAAGGASGAGG